MSPISSFRNCCILLCSMLIAFLAVEIIISQIIGYPRYNEGTRKFLIHNQLDAYNVITWRPPYYKFWSVEGGNHVYHFNNLGLPGSDTKTTLSNNNIFVLGSSFIEAANVRNDQIATSVFQRLLEKSNSLENVINLGSSGHDPYVMWFRSQFFQSRIEPKSVMLVIDPSSIPYLNKRWSDSLSFSTPDNLPKELPPSSLIKYSSAPRKYSALINLIVHGYTTQKNRIESAGAIKNVSTIKFTDSAWSKLEQSIAMFKQSYDGKLVIVSIIPDSEINHKLKEICAKHNCAFECNTHILQSENRISRNGHLNTRGNKLLGEFMHLSYMKHIGAAI